MLSQLNYPEHPEEDRKLFLKAKEKSKASDNVY